MTEAAMKTKSRGTHPMILLTNPISWAPSESFLVHRQALPWEELAAHLRNPETKRKNFHQKNANNDLKCCKIEIRNHEWIKFLQVNAWDRQKTSSYSRFRSCKDVYDFQSRFPPNSFPLISSLWRLSATGSDFKFKVKNAFELENFQLQIERREL